MDVDPGLQETIDRAAAAATGFVSGDPSGYSSLVSAGEDVSIFGAFGAGVLGRDEMLQRMAWASARFTGGDLTYEPLTAGSSGDLGYAVGVERGRVTVAGSDDRQEMALRVTQVFRREDGEWKLVHRHADPITSVTAATSVLAEDGAR